MKEQSNNVLKANSFGMRGSIVLRFAKMYPDNMKCILKAASCGRKDAAWLKLIPHVILLYTDGDKLDDLEYEWLKEWLLRYSKDNGVTVLPSDVQTVQIPRDWATKKLGHPNTAGRAICQLQSLGIIKKVHNGIKGHASLFVVLPISYTDDS